MPPPERGECFQVPPNRCYYTTRHALECANNESKGNATQEEDYAAAGRVVQVHLVLAMCRPLVSIFACLCLDPVEASATLPILSMKQTLLATMMDTQKTYFVAPYSKQFLRDRALADYFFVLANDWNAPDLAPWGFDFADM